jgi:hypothetical protein
VEVAGCIINIEKITTPGLIKMRKLIPKNTYKIIKNRKDARISRLKFKEETEKAQGKFESLLD